MSRCFFRILLLALLLFPYLAAAEVITVPTDVPTIQGAIEAAGDGDVVRVNPGTYFESLNFLGKRITVESTDGPLATIITNDPEVDLVIFNHGESSQTVLEGFTLLGGYIGVWCQEAGPTIRHNIFIDQNTRFRAAIYLSGPGYAIIGDAPAVIENNTITGCTNNGIYSYSSAAPMVKNNIIINNSNYGIGRRRVGGVAGFYVSYNDVFGNTVDYYGVSDPGPGSISTDPLLTSSYTLSEDSPCIDAGDLDPTYNDPDGTRNDMGAISFIQVLPMAADINLYPEDPTHVVSLRPTFHWTFFDTLGSQEVFEVQVGIDPDWTVAEMWVSGEVHSADAYDVYAGAPLQDGETYFWRVRVNNGTSWGGWNMSSFKMNRAPSTPTAIFPMDYNSISVTSVHLVWTGCSDADPDPVTYEFEIYTDPLLSNLVVHKSGIVGQGDEISSGVIDDLTPGVYYWWRVCAYDGYERSWSVTNAFRTQTAPIINVPADQPSIQAGINAANEGDIVLVAPGTYQESLDFTGKMITVKSAEGPQTTVITGDSSTDLVVFDEGETPGSRLEGFKLQGGRIGIWCQDAAPTIRRNLLVGQNISDWAAIMLGGPGMGVAGDAPAIIENNTVIESDHGGICSFSRSSPRIKNNIVAFNGGYGIALSELAEVVELDLSYNNLYE
ncbi:MAG: right-handed parallel beta-helix repeat-containing protein, partial [candidate division Zixibacteria bacterium]|nr:right-handed parallel beta-helix repeat-containing protein [candidate division Zixibacteria bacterium]